MIKNSELFEDKENYLLYNYSGYYIKKQWVSNAKKYIPKLKKKSDRDIALAIFKRITYRFSESLPYYSSKWIVEDKKLEPVYKLLCSKLADPVIAVKVFELDVKQETAKKAKEVIDKIDINKFSQNKNKKNQLLVDLLIKYFDMQDVLKSLGFRSLVLAFQDMFIGRFTGLMDKDISNYFKLKNVKGKILYKLSLARIIFCDRFFKREDYYKRLCNLLVEWDKNAKR